MNKLMTEADIDKAIDEIDEIVAKKLLKIEQLETQKQAHDRACEVMRGLNNAELSQMTLLRAFAMGYRDANMRSKHD